MRIVTVLPLKRGILKENLTYFSNQEIEVGDIVEVPVRSKKILGFVLEIKDALSVKADLKKQKYNLKKIKERKKTPLFVKEFWDTAISLNSYFVEKGSGIIPNLIPSVVVQNYEKILSFKNATEDSKNETNNTKIEKLLFQAPTEERISFYKTLIRGYFAQKKSVFIVLPTENALEIFYNALSKGIENFSFTLYGGVGPKKIINSIEKILETPHPVLVLGTAPFLCIPRKDLGVIILENESSNAFRTLSRPHFDLRNFVEIFASRLGVKLILGDTILRFETIARKELGEFSLVRSMSFKTNFEGDIIVEKIKREDKTDFKIFTDKNLTRIKDALLKNKKVFIFGLRKGLATMTICRDCGEIVMCKNCSSPVVLYSSKNNKNRMFMCNRCGDEKDPDTRCGYCDSWNLVPYGIGTETIVEELKERLQSDFSSSKIFRIDKESATSDNEARKIISEFEKNDSAILVGTEMALFYIKEKIPISIIASFDSIWSIPNFKISEKVVQLLMSIIKITSKNLIIQTRNEENPAILALERDDLISFVREEILDRKTLGYPPFVRFIKISYLSEKDKVLEAKKFLTSFFAEYEPDIFSGFVSKIKNRYIVNAIIKIKPEKWSTPELSTSSAIDSKLFSKIKSLPGEFEVTVDPEDII